MMWIMRILLLAGMGCLIVMGLCIFMRIVDHWQNNHFIDDKGQRYRRIKSGFQYY